MSGIVSNLVRYDKVRQVQVEPTFGFIKVDGEQIAVFMHRNDCPNRMIILEGMQVVFTVEAQDGGRFKAKNVRLAKIVETPKPQVSVSAPKNPRHAGDPKEVPMEVEVNGQTVEVCVPKMHTHRAMVHAAKRLAAAAIRSRSPELQGSWR